MMNVRNVEPGAALDEKPDNIRMASQGGLMQRRGMRVSSFGVANQEPPTKYPRLVQVATKLAAEAAEVYQVARLERGCLIKP
jgi:hypothetical protein